MNNTKTSDLPLFGAETETSEIKTTDRRKMREPFGRIDSDELLREKLLPHCRLKSGEKWVDPVSGHIVGVADVVDKNQVGKIIDNFRPTLCVADPPYNVIVGARNTKALSQLSMKDYDEFTKAWLDTVLSSMGENSSFYVWFGADMKNGMHPIPEFCIEMRRRKEWVARNWITVRNQRGYGTQKNWMWVRQELLYYIKGDVSFNIEAEYTDIPKILRGYHKVVGGKRTENLERSKSDTIRAGNVWVDIQQVFYRLKENVPGCYAQKPFKSIERIVRAGSNHGDYVLDPFSHSGTTLVACEALKRRCIAFDIDPIFAEISIRRLERLRSTGLLGWQCENPFPEIS
ncbi:MAG: site-specific DNA-methyltransferase [Alphaproteobacteria bacterium]|uniref:DNA-methyltransferase n=1 Tax=Marinobacter salarius TaxID=1420917 RepID=UPI0032F00A57